MRSARSSDSKSGHQAVGAGRKPCTRVGAENSTTSGAWIVVIASFDFLGGIAALDRCERR